MDDFLATLQMSVDKTEDSVVEVKLDHDSALPTVANQVFDDIVFLDVAHEEGVLFLDENCQENLAFAHHLHHVELVLEVAFNIAHFLDLFTSALLSTVGDNVIVAVVWEELVNEDVLGLLRARVVPRHGHYVEGDLAIDQLALARGQVLVV